VSDVPCTYTNIELNPSSVGSANFEVKKSLQRPLSLATDHRTSIEPLAGAYHSPGYGTFSLCTHASRSAYCASVLADFDALDEVADTACSSCLYAAWDKIWSSHLRFTPHPQNCTTMFEMTATQLFPHGYGINKEPFELKAAQGVRAEFVVHSGNVQGFGLFLLGGEVTERERLGKTVEERAEVWFDRLDDRFDEIL
jgi:hypothetical protein